LSRRGDWCETLVVGFSMCAFFPHPESPQDAVIVFTIVTLSEFLSSVLYSPKKQVGLLKWLKKGRLAGPHCAPTAYRRRNQGIYACQLKWNAL